MERFQKLYEHIMQQLETQLPPYLSYHDAEHTRYVLQQAITIATQENVQKEDLELIKVAALYHDAGIVHQQENHENISCSIAKEALPAFGFTERDIVAICGMIMATKIPQTPKNLLQAIVADADLEYLGTNNFESVSERLYKELRYYNPQLDRKTWLKIQIDFIEQHHYHTDFCRSFRESRKQENLALLQKQFHP